MPSSGRNKGTPSVVLMKHPHLQTIGRKKDLGWVRCSPRTVTAKMFSPSKNVCRHSRCQQSPKVDYNDTSSRNHHEAKCLCDGLGCVLCYYREDPAHWRPLFKTADSMLQLPPLLASKGLVLAVCWTVKSLLTLLGICCCFTRLIPATFNPPDPRLANYPTWRWRIPCFLS